MSFEALLNGVCSVETRSVSADSQSGERKESWSVTASSVACRLRQRSASEQLSGSLEYQKATHALYIAHRSIDSLENRVVINSAAYSITGISDMGGKGKYLCLYLERMR